MISQTKFDSTRRKIIDAFSGAARPDFGSVHPLGCCEEHESDFEWYRHHSWKEFEEELPSGRFDPFEFPALAPSAYHYLAPGILLATLHSIGTNPDSSPSWEQEWVNTLTPLEGYVEKFRRDYLPLFSLEQREAVVSHLNLFNDWLIEMKGEGDDDIGRAVNRVWRDET